MVRGPFLQDTTEGEFVPEYLMEFGTYEETNERAFDGELSKSD